MPPPAVSCMVGDGRYGDKWYVLAIKRCMATQPQLASYRS